MWRGCAGQLDSKKKIFVTRAHARTINALSAVLVNMPRGTKRILIANKASMRGHPRPPPSEGSPSAHFIRQPAADIRLD